MMIRVRDCAGYLASGRKSMNTIFEALGRT